MVFTKPGLHCRLAVTGCADMLGERTRRRIGETAPHLAAVNEIVERIGSSRPTWKTRGVFGR
jgi:hypothetical protein